MDCFLIPSHPLTNFEIQKYYESESRLNGVFSRDNLPKTIKNGAYVINLDEFVYVGTHWIALFCKQLKLFISIVLVLNAFLKKLKNSLEIKASKDISFEYKQVFQCVDTFALDSMILCLVVKNLLILAACFMFGGKKLTDFFSFFSPYDFEKNDNIILSYLKDELN